MYSIAILKDIFRPDIQGKRQVGWITDDNGAPIQYDTIGEARVAIAERDSAIHYTEHNEAGRPDYVIVEDLTVDYICGGRNGDMSNYDWADNSCTRHKGECCGECNECITMMIDQDREYIHNSAI